MDASIIIIVYNGLKYLPDCLRHIAPELTSQHEVILIDNASTDDSFAYVQDHYPQVSLVQNPSNIGFAAACNQGAKAAQGDFLIFLNQDTRVCPGWLEGLLAPFSSDSSIGLVTSKLLLMSRPGQINMCGQDIHFSGLTFARGVLQPAAEFDQGSPVGAVSGASFAIRRELWQRLGGFDEQLFMYYEETDLCWRAWLAGFSSYYSPGSVVYHDFGLKSSAVALFYAARNRWILLLKHWRYPTLLLLAPGLFMAELVDWGVMLLNGQQGVTAKARAAHWVVSNLPVVLGSRQGACSTRVKPDWFLLDRCTSILTPKILAGGLAGKVVIFFFNILFWLNYHAAWSLERWLDI